MQDTQLRFRVVFAGLHDVQRFYNISNQPLAHFGLNLRMGPLEPGPAQQLVREPLEVLGFRFVDDTTVLKVLSYTNYHPGLIQYFCYELVVRLQTRRPNTGPPYEVCSEDVESVYRSDQVRKVIRERLDWTLALDPRYQCIAWTMICEQKQMQDVSVIALSVNELLRLVRYWWNEGFNEVDSGELRILLEEMVGLGILARRSDNEFQLRSPNLVRLMGTEEVIEGRLLDLGEKPYPPQFQPAKNHSPLDHEKRVYSPLTLLQEGRIKESQESGVTLIFGSRALGIAGLDRVLAGMENSAPIPPKNLTRRDLPSKWMTAYSRTKKAHDHLITYAKLTGNGDDMARCVWSAWKKCNAFNEKQSRPMRVVFILDPTATWHWLKSSKVEASVETIYLQRWDEVGIQQRLKQADKLDSIDVCSQVRQGTGGWPMLLDELFDRCVDLDDPRTCVESVVEDLDSPQSQLRDRLLRAVGLDQRTVPTRVFKTIVECGKIRGQDVDTLADLVDGTPSLTPNDCKLAVEYLFRIGCDELKSDLWSVLERRHLYIDEVHLDHEDNRDPVEILAGSFGVDRKSKECPCTIEHLLDRGSLPEILFIDGFNDLCEDRHLKWLTVLERWANVCQTGSYVRKAGSEVPPALCILADAPNVPFPPPQTNVLLNVRFWWGMPTSLEMQLMCQVVADGETTPQIHWKQFTIPAIAGSDVELASYLWKHEFRTSSELADILAGFAQHRNWDQFFFEHQALRDDPMSEVGSSDLSQWTPQFYHAWSTGMVQCTPEYGLEQHSAVLAVLNRKEALDHRLWRGQAGFLLPKVDETRLALCEYLSHVYGNDWTYKWQFPETDRELVEVKNTPYACQWGHLKSLLKRRELYSERRWRGLANSAWAIRTELAHYRPIDFANYENYCVEKERLKSPPFQFCV